MKQLFLFSNLFYLILMAERGKAGTLVQASQRMPASLSSEGGHGTQSRLASHGDVGSAGATDQEMYLGIQS